MPNSAALADPDPFEVKGGVEPGEADEGLGPWGAVPEAGVEEEGAIDPKPPLSMPNSLAACAAAPCLLRGLWLSSEAVRARSADRAGSGCCALAGPSAELASPASGVDSLPG